MTLKGIIFYLENKHMYLIKIAEMFLKTELNYCTT